MKKESSGATLMKTMISGAGAMFMKRSAPEPEQRHFYDGSTALPPNLSPPPVLEPRDGWR